MMSDAKVDPHFAGLVLNLQSSTWIYLGKVANPLTGKIDRNLEAAKETIDLLGMLETKTRGNLAEDEERLLRGLLTDLRMNYVQEVGKGTQASEEDSKGLADSDQEPGSAEATGAPTGDAKQ